MMVLLILLSPLLVSYTSAGVCPCTPDTTTGAYNATYCATSGAVVQQSCQCTQSPTCVTTDCATGYTLVSAVTCTSTTSTRTCQRTSPMTPCASCVPGRWGPSTASCKNICPGGVTNPCSGLGTCSESTGVCTCSDPKYATPACATCSTNYYGYPVSNVLCLVLRIYFLYY
jgi:hypothetical protein